MDPGTLQLFIIIVYAYILIICKVKSNILFKDPFRSRRYYIINCHKALLYRVQIYFRFLLLSNANIFYLFESVAKRKAECVHTL